MGSAIRWSPVCPCSRARSKPWDRHRKKSLPAVERQCPETAWVRQRFQTKLSRVPPQDLVFIDESGVRTDLTRRDERDLSVTSVAHCGHDLPGCVRALNMADAVISIEIRERETAEYVRDLIRSGQKKAMIDLPHEGRRAA